MGYVGRYEVPSSTLVKFLIVSDSVAPSRGREEPVPFSSQGMSKPLWATFSI